MKPPPDPLETPLPDPAHLAGIRSPRVARKVDGLLLECRKCGQMLPRGRFHRSGKGGLTAGGRWRAWCKQCMRPHRAAVAARRRSRVVGTYTGEDVSRLAVRQGYMCGVCRRDLRVVGYHVDHVVPIAKGGLNVVSNLQLLCARCNLSKGARLVGGGGRLVGGGGGPAPGGL